MKFDLVTSRIEKSLWKFFGVTKILHTHRRERAGARTRTQTTHTRAKREWESERNTILILFYKIFSAKKQKWVRNDTNKFQVE